MHTHTHTHTHMNCFIARKYMQMKCFQHKHVCDIRGAVHDKYSHNQTPLLTLTHTVTIKAPSPPYSPDHTQTNQPAQKTTLGRSGKRTRRRYGRCTHNNAIRMARLGLRMVWSRLLCRDTRLFARARLFGRARLFDARFTHVGLVSRLQLVVLVFAYLLVCLFFEPRV